KHANGFGQILRKGEAQVSCQPRITHALIQMTVIANRRRPGVERMVRGVIFSDNGYANLENCMMRCPRACAGVPLPTPFRPLSIETSTRSSQARHRAATGAIEPEQKEDALHKIRLTPKAPY